MKQYPILIITLFFIIGCNYNYKNKVEKDFVFKEIDSLIEISKNTDKSDSLRTNYILKATTLIEQIDNDSLKIMLLNSVAKSNFELGNLKEFAKISRTNLELSEWYKDTLNIGNSNVNLGNYYRLNNKSDMAFYHFNKALNNYKSVNNKYLYARTLLEIARIQTNESDFMGSEINVIKALAIFNEIKSDKGLFASYDILGVNSFCLKKYDQAIEYNKKALIYTDKLESSISYRLDILNSIGLSYQYLGNFSEALKYYKEALATSNFENKYPKVYARILSNYAYTLFKNKALEHLPALFYKSLTIQTNNYDEADEAITYLYLSEFEFNKKDTLKAQNFALKAITPLKAANEYFELLEAYQLLSKILPAKEGIKYLEKHISLSDSLLQNERAIREKFMRIVYETNEIRKEKEKETQNKWLIAIFSAIGFIISSLIIITLIQLSKNKTLLFNQQQEEVNIEIYNLMIDKRLKYEEGINEEKKRISEELHDGVLGRLFGTRLSLDSLNNSKSKTDIKVRAAYINELQSIEEEIRKIAHNLQSQIKSGNTSFKKMIEELLMKQSEVGKFEWNLNFNSTTNSEKISNKIKIHCYRTIQEAVQNIIKYANATFVEIDIKEYKNNWLIEIKDNGVGFDVSKNYKGIGLRNIKSRVKSLNGNVKFISKPEEGTIIKMTIPLQNL
ncbi:tetratricopeptide repeat protein [Lutibacter sp. HS1-25]|uniref:tetratricopeptide repeat-containing sensor histidine kinase n=1 Tax=Lutibacter sp. HS1-25 TaxID=2485000 RepID=UPI0010138953|nr:sensor histidine kinase [Lutibacter sp. HS1-25]RXP64563.1 tetratricopeptide repeat protein [Lutibacter sp. HS1-25]